ncbi:nuclear transport factor 2 family protein [Streptomyces sp. NPDC019443]|uniref:nuclear transport factor 2 family protein n=1 Tax=Streptomyces sp. NPDC019443 TaxID=3365061 RepID=UPI0037B73BF2
MTQENAIRVAKSFYDAVEQRNFDTASEILHSESTVWNEHERSDHPARPVFNGSHPLWSALAEFRYTERKYMATDHEVTVEYVARGTTVRGRQFAFPVTARLFLTSDGRGIRRIEEFFGLADSAAFQEVLAD